MKFSEKTDNGLSLYSPDISHQIQIFFPDDVSIPYFMISGRCDDTFQLTYGQHSGQDKLKGLISEDHLVEVLSKAPFPILYTYGPKNIIAAKYFLAEHTGKGLQWKVIYAGMYDRETKETHIYVDKEGQKDYKTAIEKSMADFTGEITQTPNIGKYFGKTMEVPQFKTVGERTSFIKGIVERALEEIKSEVKE